MTSAWKIKTEGQGGARRIEIEEKGERGDELRRKTKKDRDRRVMQRERGGVFGKHFITTLLLQLSYLQSNNIGPGSAGQCFSRNRTGE